MKNTITIVGVGALGSHLVPLIRNLEGDIRIIDFDRIEAKNTMSQLHGKHSQGKLKIDSIKQTMQLFFGLKILGFPTKLVENNTIQLLGGSTLLVDCLDNGPSRRIVQKFASDHKIACIHGALAADGSYGSVTWTEHFRADDATIGAATCEDGRFLPFISMVSSYLAQAIKVFMETGKKENFQVYPTGARKI